MVRVTTFALLYVGLKDAIGGLLVDLGVLQLKPGSLSSSFYPDPKSSIPKLPPSHPAIVEWRAMTIIEL